jgi:hypothetical protein
MSFYCKSDIRKSFYNKTKIIAWASDAREYGGAGVDNVKNRFGAQK